MGFFPRNKIQMAIRDAVVKSTAVKSVLAAEKFQRDPRVPGVVKVKGKNEIPSPPKSFREVVTVFKNKVEPKKHTTMENTGIAGSGNTGIVGTSLGVPDSRIPEQPTFSTNQIERAQEVEKLQTQGTLEQATDKTNLKMVGVMIAVVGAIAWATKNKRGIR